MGRDMSQVDHCALYGRGTATASRSALAIRGYELKLSTTSKGAIRFTPDKPLPERLVRRLVEMKVAKNAQVSKTVKSPRVAS